jgi:ATP-dependent DNA ligase
MLSRSPSPSCPTGFIAPCLPTLARTVPDGPRWAFEIKHDGFRFIARRDGDRAHERGG